MRNAKKTKRLEKQHPKVLAGAWKGGIGKAIKQYYLSRKDDFLDVENGMTVRGFNKRTKICKVTKKEHEFIAYKDQTKSYRVAVCKCSKHLWIEFLCRSCNTWYKNWRCKC